MNCFHQAAVLMNTTISPPRVLNQSLLGACIVGSDYGVLTVLNQELVQKVVSTCAPGCIDLKNKVGGSAITPMTSSAIRDCGMTLPILVTKQLHICK